MCILSQNCENTEKNAHSSEVDLGVKYGIHKFFFEIIFFEHHCFQLFWISKQISRHQVLC